MLPGSTQKICSQIFFAIALTERSFTSGWCSVVARRKSWASGSLIVSTVRRRRRPARCQIYYASKKPLNQETSVKEETPNRSTTRPCHYCHGTGERDGRPCPACDGKGELQPETSRHF